VTKEPKLGAIGSAYSQTRMKDPHSKKKEEKEKKRREGLPYAARNLLHPSK
jgi:hypothetical protein